MSSGQNQFLCLAPEIRPAAVLPSPTKFLSLAPDVSDSHPRAQRTRADSSASSSAGSSSSSSSRSGSASPTLAAQQQDPTVAVANTRVLKLSPVHWGAHAEDHQGDYHDVPKSA
ncbi:hypothetical protein PWT90_02746 [Aphanocladium album]|nr:hypothetical protein PWT90_02746 [Aphanocladium album]